MKTNNKLKRFFRKTKKTIGRITYKSIEHLDGFIQASIKQKPLLYLFNRVENAVENTLTKLEKRNTRNKEKRQEKKIIKEQHIDREQLLSDEKQMSKEVFFERLAELKKQFPIKILEQDLTLEQ